MRRYRILGPGGIEDLRIEETERPVAGYGEVLLRVRATSLNYRDLGIASGGYLRNDRCPVVPLSDASAEVAEIGPGVGRWNVGDRVSPIFVQDWIDGPPTDAVLRTSLGGGIDGVLTEYVTCPEGSLVRIPDDWSHAQAATVPCAAVTASHALFESGDLQAGQTVLLLGTGGVSIFALQLAKSVGATVIITSASDDKLARTRELGADHTINYRKVPQWHQEVRRLTANRGVDHVVEVGGPGTLERSLKSTTVGGHVHLVGVLDSPTAKVGPMISVFNLLTVRGIYVGSRQMHERTLARLVEAKIDPWIDRTFGWEEAVDAYRYLARQEHFGKIVIEC